MNTQPVWNSLELAKLVASLGTPIVVALIGFWINRRLRASDRRFEKAKLDRNEALEAAERERQKELKAAELEQETRREAEKDERYRRNAPHIELKLDCQFHGFRDGNHLVTFLVSATNVGHVWHNFKVITLRVRGIKDGPFEYFVRRGQEARDKDARRVAFPHELLKTNLVPWRFVFIEPGVTQHLTLTTTVPSDYSYLLANVVFEYKKYWPHTVEAVFKVPVVQQ